MPGPELLLGGIILGALVLYALLGGADFGGGLWDLLARGPRRAEQRALIARAIAPVWEVNHVWLILALVLLFTGFPLAFSALGTALHVPLVLFLLGIVARGSAFAFRSFDSRGERANLRWGLLFSGASLISPLLLGATVGALASGRVVVGEPWAWLSPFTFVTGLFALALFGFLAAVYLCNEAEAPALAEDFRRRALLSAGVVALLAAAVLGLAHDEAPRVFYGLWRSPWALGLHGATAVVAVATFVFLGTRRYRAARLSAAAQVGLIVLGWGISQFPYLIVPTVTLAQGGAHPETQRLVLRTLPWGGAVLGPSLALLFWVFKRRPSAAPPANP
jgi:cytochrome d ubiquinol oxidase subunit II